MNLQKMTKKQLEAHGRTIGIELDRRKSKKDMISELNKASKPFAKKKPTKKKPITKKAPAKKKPTKKKTVIVSAPSTIDLVAELEKASTKNEPKIGFWESIKKFFNL
jgi:hypothetical protein